MPKEQDPHLDAKDNNMLVLDFNILGNVTLHWVQIYLRYPPTHIKHFTGMVYLFTIFT